LSIAAPLVGVGALIFIIFYFIFPAKDSEGQLWGQVFGVVVGGLILFGSTIFGLGLALASRKKENCRLLSLIGFILNIILLLWILYILIPIFLSFIIK
jgi:hypothetical protein